MQNPVCLVWLCHHQSSELVCDLVLGLFPPHLHTWLFHSIYNSPYSTNCWTMVLEDLHKPKWRQNSHRHTLRDSPIATKISKSSTRRRRASSNIHASMDDEECITFTKIDDELSPTVMASPGSSDSGASRLFSYDPSFELSAPGQSTQPEEERSKHLEFHPWKNSPRRMYLESEQRQTTGFARKNLPTQKSETKQKPVVPLILREQRLHSSMNNQPRESQVQRMQSRITDQFPTVARKSQEHGSSMSSNGRSDYPFTSKASRNAMNAPACRNERTTGSPLSSYSKEQGERTQTKEPKGYYHGSSRMPRELPRVSSSDPVCLLPDESIPCRSSKKCPEECKKHLAVGVLHNDPVICSKENQSDPASPAKKKQKLWRRLLFRRKKDRGLVKESNSQSRNSGTQIIPEPPNIHPHQESIGPKEAPDAQMVDTLCKPRKRIWPWSRRKKNADKESEARRDKLSNQSKREQKSSLPATETRPGLDPVFCPGGKPETPASPKMSTPCSQSSPNHVSETNSGIDDDSSDGSDCHFSIEAWSHNLSAYSKERPQRGRGRSPRHNSTNGRNGVQNRGDLHSREVHYFAEPPLRSDETDSLSGTTVSDTTVVRSNAMSQRSSDASDLDTSLSSSTMLGRVDENEIDIEPSRLLQRLERVKNHVEADTASETDSALMRRKRHVSSLSSKKLSPPTKVNAQSIVSMKGTWFSAEDVDVWNVRTENPETSISSEPEAEGIEMELSCLTSGSEHSGEVYHDAMDDLTMLQNIKRKLDVFQYSKKKRVAREKGEPSCRAERWRSMLRTCEYESDYSSCCSTVSDSLSDKPLMFSD